MNWNLLGSGMGIYILSKCQVLMSLSKFGRGELKPKSGKEIELDKLYIPGPS